MLVSFITSLFLSLLLNGSLLGLLPFLFLTHACLHTQTDTHTHTHTHSVSHTLNLTEVFTWHPEAEPSLKGLRLTGILFVSRGAVWLSEVS